MTASLAGASCLVLGAGGFIGSHLCRALVAAGARVHGFGRRPAYPDALPTMRYTTGDFLDRAATALAVDGTDIVFHLLGGTNPEVSNKDPIADLQVGTIASVRLLELCRAASVQRIVFVSSGGAVYGVPRSVPIDEREPTEPISAYGINKLTVEKYLQLYRRANGARAISLRVANPFGPFQSPFRRQGLVAALMETMLAGRPVEVWGDGRVVRDYVFVQDVAAALLSAATYDGDAAVMNVGSGVGRSVLDVVESVAAVLEVQNPAIVFKAARRADVPSNVLDIRLAERELGWRPKTDWPTGLRRTADWIAANHGSTRD